MASERVSSVVEVNDDAPQSNVHVEPAPPTQEANPFSSREGSPRQYTIPPSASNPQFLSAEKFPDGDSHNGLEDRNNIAQGLPTTSPSRPSPVRFPSEGRYGVRRQLTADTGRYSHLPHSVLDLDHIVPVDVKPANIKYRLTPTLEEAIKTRDAFKWRAKWTGNLLNAAIGLQVVLGSLTTGLSAAATTGKSAAVQTTILGGLSTIVASYLARARGSNEPELSNAKVKDLDHFIRECNAFILDHGHITGNQFDSELNEKRQRFELLLGNTSKGDPEPKKSEAAKPEVATS